MYSTYKHLIGQSYTSGDKDCYGLARDYYRDIFQIELSNFARPELWWDEPSLNLLTDNVLNDGFEDIGVNLRNLKVGDGLIFSLISSRANHVGIYVGNGMFIHHVYQRQSSEEALVQKWMSRCLMVVRHPLVTASQEKQVQTINFMDLDNGKMRSSL